MSLGVSRSTKQCCGTGIICCGFGSDFGKNGSSSSESTQYLAQFSNNKNFSKNLAFSMAEAALFSILIYPDPNPVLELDPEQEMHSGSCGSVSTTLPQRFTKEKPNQFIV
jgi:hypothetical protein